MRPRKPRWWTNPATAALLAAQSRSVGHRKQVQATRERKVEHPSPAVSWRWAAASRSASRSGRKPESRRQSWQTATARRPRWTTSTRWGWHASSRSWSWSRRWTASTVQAATWSLDRTCVGSDIGLAFPEVGSVYPWNPCMPTGMIGQWATLHGQTGEGGSANRRRSWSAPNAEACWAHDCFPRASRVAQPSRRKFLTTTGTEGEDQSTERPVAPRPCRPAKHRDAT